MQWLFLYNSSPYTVTVTPNHTTYSEQKHSSEYFTSFLDGLPFQKHELCGHYYIATPTCILLWAFLFFFPNTWISEKSWTFEFYFVLVSDVSLFSPQTVTLKATSPWPRTQTSLSLDLSLTLSPTACVLAHFPWIPNRCAPYPTALGWPLT